MHTDLSLHISLIWKMCVAAFVCFLSWCHHNHPSCFLSPTAGFQEPQVEVNLGLIIYRDGFECYLTLCLLHNHLIDYWSIFWHINHFDYMLRDYLVCLSQGPRGVPGPKGDMVGSLQIWMSVFMFSWTGTLGRNLLIIEPQWQK